ncbi:MAG TPA: prolyl oligopeptidase family serine peptidase, partial [Acidimicrobiales bacterium]
GVSAGGNLAMLVGTGGSGDPKLPPIRAVATWSGFSDLTILATPDGRPHPADPPSGCMGQSICIGISSPGALTDFVGCTLEQCPSRYVAASPVSQVTKTTPPMYLTAAQDDFAPFDQSQRMGAALAAKGVAAEAVAVPGAGHAETLKPYALAPTLAFFHRLLG